MRQPIAGMASPHPNSVNVRVPVLHLIQGATSRENSAQKVSSDPSTTAGIKEMLAYAKQQAGDVEGAIQIYEELMDKGVASRRARLRYARLLNAENRHSQALRVLQTLDDEGEDLELTELLARTAWWAKAYDQARQYYRNWLDLEPRNEEAQKTLNRLLVMAQKTLTVEDYRKWLHREPDNSDALRGLAALYRKKQEYEKAVEVYTRLEQLQPSPTPQLQLGMARTYLWAGRPAQAADHYQTYISENPDASPDIWAEYGQSLLESRQPEPALKTARRALKQYPAAAPVLEVAARSATALDRPKVSAAYLERLNRQRGLTGEEKKWLAGLYGKTGRPKKALDIYLGLLGLPLPSKADGYQPDSFDRHRASLVLKIARTADRAGFKNLCAAAYLAYADQNPQDFKVLKEASNSLMDQEMYSAALKVTRQLIKGREEKGHHLRMARLNFYLQDYQKAQEWADAALEKGEAKAQSLFLLGQIAHVQGADYRASGLLEQAAGLSPEDPDIRLWWGYSLEQTNRHLGAFQEYSRSLTLGVDRPGRGYLSRGDAARKIGDLDLAQANYNLAEHYGADPEALSQSRAALEEHTRPRMWASPYFFRDSNDLDQFQVEATADFWPRRILRLGLEYGFMAIEQREVHYDLHSLRVYARDWHPHPRMDLGLSVGAHIFDETENTAPDPLFVGDLEATLRLRPTTSLSALVFRESFYQPPGPYDPRRYNRVVDLEALPADASKWGGRLRFDHQFHPSQDKLRIELGADAYQPTNQRWWGYTHYQFQVYNSPDRNTWLAFKPNLFLEAFDDPDPAYFTPSGYAALGGILHLRTRWGMVGLEAEVNPQLQVQDQEGTGFGGYGLVKVFLDVDYVTTGVETFGFWDDNDQYTLWRVGWFIEAHF
ncbi:MAG: tetratricopeptide repeat protein [Desulfatiglandaceae bacterium]